MSEDILCSVIVPVYNVEKYLAICLESLLNGIDDQSEIILILGDSTDRSNEICLSYENLYQNVFCIWQTGNGLSNARNCGLKIARGKFVSFIDSDDFVSSENYKKIITFLKENITSDFDALLTDYVRVLENGEILEPVNILLQYESPVVVNDEEIQLFLKKRNCFWNVWRYIYRREFLIKNQIWFLENRTTEDVDYTAKVFLKQSKLVFWHNPYYFYRTGRYSSLVNQIDLKRIQDVTDILETTIQTVQQSDRLYAKNIIEQFRLEYLLNIVLLADNLSPQAKYCFKSWKTVLGQSSKVYLRLSSVLIRFCGLEKVSICLRWLRKMRRIIKSNWRKRHEKSKTISE